MRSLKWVNHKALFTDTGLYLLEQQHWLTVALRMPLNLMIPTMSHWGILAQSS
jgi:hypothetical protein